MSGKLEPLQKTTQETVENTGGGVVNTQMKITRDSNKGRVHVINRGTGKINAVVDDRSDAQLGAIANIQGNVDPAILSALGLANNAIVNVEKREAPAVAPPAYTAQIQQEQTALKRV